VKDIGKKFRGLEFGVWGLDLRTWRLKFGVWGYGFGFTEFIGRGVNTRLPRFVNS